MGLSDELVGKTLRLVRKHKKLSRGQIAKWLQTSPTVIYNLETGRSRIKLSVFFQFLNRCGFKAEQVISHHLSSIQTLTNMTPGEIVKVFRRRLKFSQKELGKALGYQSASMIHHFEKEIREPSFQDFLLLMQLTGDNIRGLIFELTKDKAFSENFPEGAQVVHQDWQEYWQAFYIPAIRQLMRTTAYEKIPRYKPGYFAKILGISEANERHALEVLLRFNVIRWQNAKPTINPGINIVMPQNIPQETLNNLKVQWLEFSKRHFLESTDKANLFSVDLIPVNRQIVAEIVRRIRALQDEIHSLTLADTDGFVSLSWLANYVAI